MLYTNIFDGIHTIYFRVHVYGLHVHFPIKMYALYVKLQFYTSCSQLVYIFPAQIYALSVSNIFIYLFYLFLI